MVNDTETMPRIGVVIPCHNRRDKTLRCLKSLLSARHEGFILDVIVVDDGSTDGTSEAIGQVYPGVYVLPGTGDLYWTASVNLGIRKALDLGSDWVLILNDDTIHDPEFLVHLYACAKEHPGAILGATILYMSRPEIIRFAGASWTFGRWGWGWYYTDEGRTSSSLGTTPRNVESINGNCCLVPRKIFLELGDYDQVNFPHYYADVAYTIRARKGGIPLYIEPRARVWDDDSDIPEKLAGPTITGAKIIERVFFTRTSFYYWRAFFLVYWLTPPSKIQGVVAFLYRLTRISARVFLALIRIRPFYSNGKRTQHPNSGIPVGQV